MKKLVSSSEAAYLLGLSLQGVHYRIKKGQLESIKKEGKTYVYIDASKVKHDTSSPAAAQNEQGQAQQVSELVKVKDEQISFLKKSIKYLKKHHLKEINRLEQNQEKILNVFQGEVDLLKSAFNEMKNIYSLEHKKVDEFRNKEQNTAYKTQMQFMDIKDFFVFMKEHNKTDSQIKKMILERVKMGDKRFIYDRKNKEVLIYKSDFLDLL